MTDPRDQILRYIEQTARLKAGRFARELVHSPSEDKEEILAGLEFEAWLAETCRDCLDCLDC